MTDYLEIWNRFNVLMVLPDEDRKTLVENLHEETRAGIEMLASLAIFLPVSHIQVNAGASSTFLKEKRRTKNC